MFKTKTIQFEHTAIMFECSSGSYEHFIFPTINFYYEEGMPRRLDIILELKWFGFCLSGRFIYFNAQAPIK